MTAIITDVRYRMSLALIRDLGERGVHIIACESADCPAPIGFSSRYVSRCVRLSAADPLLDLRTLCAAVLEEDGEPPVLLPVGAKTLGQLAATQELFSPVCALCIPTVHQLDTFNSKEEVARLGQSLGIPVPAAYARNETESESDFFARVPLPCVVKPICGEKQGLSAAQRYAISRTTEELAQWYHHFIQCTGAPPLVQEYLTGGGLGCSVLADKGRVIRVICHRRLREYPVTGGPSTCCQALLNPTLTAYAAQLVEAVGYSGLAMLEFKEDEQGAPRLLEINPRVWGTYPLTRVTGADFSYTWLLLARKNAGLEAEIPPQPPLQLRKMAFYPSDFAAALGYLRQGTKNALFSCLGDWLNPHVGDGLFEWKDPRPGFAYYHSLLNRR